MLGTVRERVLVPDVVAYAVQRALETFSDGMRQEPSLRARLEKIEGELGNLARFAAKTGRVDEAADLFAELEAERESLRAQLGAVPPTSIDAEALRALAEERVLELRRALDLSPDRGRSLFLSLLGDRRMRVGADPEHGFRVEGVFDLGLDAGPARVREGLRAGPAFGSGGVLRTIADSRNHALAA